MSPVLENFLQGLDHVKTTSPWGWCVDRLMPELYQQGHVQCVPGQYGFCVSPGGELMGVWSMGGGNLPLIVEEARTVGASWLSCYDTGLVERWEKSGCVASLRAPFSIVLAPVGWIEGLHGLPDYVTMKV